MSKNQERLVILCCVLCAIFCPIGIWVSIRVALEHSNLLLLMLFLVTGLSFLLFSSINKNAKLKEKIRGMRLEMETLGIEIAALHRDLGYLNDLYDPSKTIEGHQKLDV